MCQSDLVLMMQDGLGGELFLFGGDNCGDVGSHPQLVNCLQAPYISIRCHILTCDG